MTSFAIRIIQYVRSSRDGIDEPRADFHPAYRLIVGHLEKRSVTPNPARHLEPRRLSPAIEGARPAWFPGKCGHFIFGSTGNLRGKYREWQEVASFPSYTAETSSPPRKIGRLEPTRARKPS